MVEITFHGAADTVTGSRYLVTTSRARVLVDCGLFQGPKKLRERNWRMPTFEPEHVDAVVLTHAHIDHSGFLPRLCQLGFRGPIYCTPGTRDLLQLLLPDAAHLQEEEAELANRRGYSQHRPALPLYTQHDAAQALRQLVTIDFHASFQPAHGVSATFHRAGHIVGSAWITLVAEDTRVLFTGDLGRPNDPVMRPPDPPEAADVLVTESTYGDRQHPVSNIGLELAELVIDAVERRGALVVPAFAVGRSQHLMVVLDQLRRERRIPDCPVFLDSPMAIDASQLLGRHIRDHRLTPDEWRAACAGVQYARTPDESKQIDRLPGPKIVIAASGMCTGGRVLHHLVRYLPDERATIAFVGYQATGTRGRALLDGAQELRLLGQYVPVRARVKQLEGLSAHADAPELLAWFASGPLAPRSVFVTHGEPAAADALRRRIRETFGWSARVPDLDERVALTAS